MTTYSVGKTEKTGFLVSGLVGIQNGASPIWRGIWQFLAKLHMYLPFDPAIPLLGVYPKDILAKMRQDVSTKLCIEAPFVIVKKTRNHSNVHKQGLADRTRMTLQLKREGGESLDDVMTSSPGYNVK